MESFADLLVKTIPPLRRYARSLTGDFHQAEDLVQDCLDRAWSRMGQWRSDTNMRAWVFTIMHNLYINQARRNRRTKAWQSLDDPEPIDHREQGQESAMNLRDLEKGLARLSEDQREVLMLVCVEGMSYEQVAQVLSIPIGTVMSRLHRAREQMRSWMHGEESPRLRRIK